MRLRSKLLIVAIILAEVFLWGRCGKSRTGVSPTPNVLPLNDAEQITVDPSTHQLVILRPNGERIVETLPDRPSTIDILKNGTVNVTSKQFGFEHHMFIGLLGSDHLRVGAGADLWYFKKLDLGIGIADQMGAYTPIVFGKVTWNVKGNLQVGLIYGSNKYIGGVLAVRIF
jgi:hypothetical protein